MPKGVNATGVVCAPAQYCQPAEQTRESLMIPAPTRGAGAAEMMGVEDAVDLHLGTLSKSIGSFGGFLACSAAWKSLLVTKARGQVFSTALPLPSVAGALAGIRVAREVRE